MQNSTTMKICVAISLAANISLSIFCPTVALIFLNIIFLIFVILIFTGVLIPCYNPPVPKIEKTAKDERIFKQIEDYFSRYKPFLEMNITIDDVARAIFTNRSYASHALNVCYGDNFSQYVNSYRINYAIECFKKNPSMNVEDLSVASGFSNANCFCTAFKLRMKCTPLEWMISYRGRGDF